MLRFTIVDADGAGDHDLIGEVQTSMSQIMNDKKKLVFEDILTIPGKKVNRGQIIIRGEFVHVSHYTT